jgi:AbrB family looped-hinge helix DNA binding protein
VKAIVSEKGQIPIPKPLRDRLGIRPGQVLDFAEERGRLVATKAAPENPVEAVYGILRLKRRTDEVMRTLRGEPEE